MTQGKTKIKCATNIIPEGTSKKRDPEGSTAQKRTSPGTVSAWKSKDCSGSPMNTMRFAGENLPVTLNDVSSIKVSGVPDVDVAFACSDKNCHVDHQEAVLTNDDCIDVSGKKVNSAMVIGVVTPVRPRDISEDRLYSRSLTAALADRADSIACDASGGADYTDALKVGDKWQGDNGMACCCHLPGGRTSQSVGSAKASFSDNIQCPVNPSGQPPPATACPMICNSMRAYVYAIATKCKTGDNKTGGSVTLPGDWKISLGHS